MKKSFQYFTRRLIDYAGLFPPAELSLDRAVHDYVHYRNGSESWMLGRFIVSSNLLAAFVDEAEPLAKRYDLSVLIGGGANAVDYLQNLELSLKRLTEFNQRYGERFSISALEVRLPSPADLGGGVGQIISEAGARIGASEFSMTPTYYEWGFAEPWRESMEEANEAIELIPGSSSGLKIRCGGVVPAAFPSTEQLAYALSCCRNHDLAFKATAGLHHPFRHHNEVIGTMMHGFINLFLAALLAYEHGIDEATIQEVLNEESPARFVFEEDGCAWRQLRIETDRILELRKRRVGSFGSCSFDEPREDLRELGLLPRN